MKAPWADCWMSVRSHTARSCAGFSSGQQRVFIARLSNDLGSGADKRDLRRDAAKARVARQLPQITNTAFGPCGPALRSPLPCQAMMKIEPDLAWCAMERSSITLDAYLMGAATRTSRAPTTQAL